MSGLSKPPTGTITGTAVDPLSPGGVIVDPTTELTQPGGPFPAGHTIQADGLGGYVIAASPAGTTLPVDDGTAVVKGSADATKLVRIEADGLTTSTTRVITMPDKDVILDDAADTRTPSSHALGGSEHSADTLANLNSKVSDATLIDTGDSRLSDARTPTAHDLGGAEHSADTLANLNLKVSDATLIDTADSRLSDSRAPSGTAGGDLGGSYPNPTVDDGADGTAIHDNVASEISAVIEKVTPVSGDFLLIEDSAAANAKKRILVGNLPGGATLPVVDTTAVVKGSTDATKLVRIEADALTTATTRVINMPDKDVTLDDTADSRPPSGTAGGDLGGTYPNPTVDDGADGTAIHDDTSGEISAITEKTAPVAADLLVIEDSAATNAKKRVQIGNLPPRSDINYGFGEFTTTSGTYVVVPAGRFIFRGTTALGIPTAVILLGGINGTATGDYRIRDITNTTTIAELTGVSAANPTSIDLGTLSNLSTGFAVWEIQLLRASGSGGNVPAVCGINVQF